MLKTAVSLFTAISLLLSSGYNPSMTEKTRVKSDISALNASALGQVRIDDTFTAEQTGEGYIYTNYLDGYSIRTAEKFQADVTLSNIRLHLENEDKSIDIYKESFASPTECETYSAYSSGFSEDVENYSVQRNEKTVINGKKACVIQWTRESLGEDDKNNYAGVDIFDGTDVYSFIFKSRKPMDQWDYMSVAESTEFFKGSGKEPYIESFGGASEITHPETRERFKRIFLEDKPVSWGLYLHKQPQQGMSRYEDTERSIGIKTEICLFYAFIYKQYDRSQIGECLEKAWNSGKICELTLQFPPKAESGIVYEILKGKYDGFLYDMANDVAEFDHPVMMRLFNEMNGDWCNYSGYHTSRDPEIYIRLYKYVYNIFKKCRAENVIWVWNPNEKSFPNFKWNSEEMYYPGGAYVDVVGLTGYNTGTYYEGETWRSFDRIYRDIYTKADMLYKKPMMITEFSCAVTGGDKTAWVKDMFASLPSYPKLKAAVWWSSCDYAQNGEIARSYYIDDTPGVMALFRENLSSAEK